MLCRAALRRRARRRAALAATALSTKIIDGLAHLSANGLRYPIPQYGIQNDARAGLAVSYAPKG